MVADCVLDQVSPAHAAVLSELHSAIFPDGWTARSMQDILSMPGAFGAIVREKDMPCALVLALLTPDNSEILTIGVLPQARRKGLARLLLDHVVQVSLDHKVTSVFLEVSVHNLPAIGFYRDHGFERISQRYNYYKLADGTREDALVLRRLLCA